ncbi:MAG: hypothetical protein ACXAC2_17720 [Candidatus Kariarchaeaceae archaeon]|jgi:hypothetical protein
MNKREEAKRYMQHYFNLSTEKDLDWDNIAEINSLVDLIIDAAKEEILEELDREK